MKAITRNHRGKLPTGEPILFQLPCHAGKASSRYESTDKRKLLASSERYVIHSRHTLNVTRKPWINSLTADV
jgi:hypothetical protein